METLANLESFVQSAELGGFSPAARRMAVTPAAVSRNVAMLEKNLGVRLFHRSTRKLTLTEAGERFLHSVRDNLAQLQSAISDVSADNVEPAGVLKISVSPTFGIGYLLPMLPEFMRRYPLIRPEWVFENRQVDLVAEGLDAAIGGGFDLTPGVVSKTLAPAHVVAVASPGFMSGKTGPVEPEDLAAYDGIAMRSVRTGRIRHWQMRNAVGEERLAAPIEKLVVNDPAAMCRAALLGLGVTLISKADALPHLESGELVRLLPDWYADAGPISIYYANRTLLPAKTRAFVDFVADTFRRNKLAEKFAGSLGQNRG
jgi:DNA-binding transcriptional LysR family regulator